MPQAEAVVGHCHEDPLFFLRMNHPLEVLLYDGASVEVLFHLHKDLLLYDGAEGVSVLWEVREIGEVREVVHPCSLFVALLLHKDLLLYDGGSVEVLFHLHKDLLLYDGAAVEVLLCEGEEGASVLWEVPLFQIALLVVIDLVAVGGLCCQSDLSKVISCGGHSEALESSGTY